MRVCFILIAVAACIGFYQAGAVAANWVDCYNLDGNRYSNVIFCEDFDTYCSGNSNGYPGGPKCAEGASKDEVTEGRVWRRTSSNEYNGNLMGQELNIQEDDYLNGSYYLGTFIWPDYPNYGDNPEYPSVATGPYGAGLPCDGNVRLGQMTFRDWVLSGLPMDTTPQVLNMSRLIGNVFNTPGHTYDLVAGTDANPLVLKYWLGGGGLGKIYITNGFVEVALNDERANTDYVRSVSCEDSCMPFPIHQGPFPIMCAQNNPEGGPVAGCPPVATAPIHGAIAVGALATLDTDPCHCPSDQGHGPHGYRLAVFDGQAWWSLRKDSIPGATFSGTVLPFKSNSVLPPPPNQGIGEPGDFVIDGGEGYQTETGGNPRSWHFIKLSIKSTTIDVEMTTQEKCTGPDDYQYYVKSVVTGIPRKYVYTGSGPIGSGAFNTLRIGIGSGCVLDNNTSWTTCAVNEAGHRSRTAIQVDPNPLSMPPKQASLFFNDLIFYGGAGFANEGACCAASGTPACTEVLQENCTGLFKGPSTKCAGVNCCPRAWGDTNRDGSVDMQDFAELQRCITAGSGATVTGSCLCLDADNDQKIGSAADIQRFIDCANGPNVPGATASPCNGYGGW